VFAGIDLETGVVGERRVQQAERMRKMDFPQDREVVSASQRGGRGGPLADAVHGEDQRFVERGGEERARGVAEMVFGEEEALLPVEAVAIVFQGFAKQTLLKELFPDP